MGKIFGISNNPVSTIESAIGLKPIKIEYPGGIKPIKIVDKNDNMDNFVSKKITNNSNPIVKMRNGFGKLMDHFSHKKD